MHAESLVLALVVITALGFDFTNGFHDTANAMATSIATGALPPRVAVTLSAVMNLAGAFLSVSVALTVTNAVVNTFEEAGPSGGRLTMAGPVLMSIVLAGLIGGIVWNLITWLLGIPSSSSHALFGGLIGAAIASIGMSGVNWAGSVDHLHATGTPDGVIGKVVLPAIVSPLLAALVATTGTLFIYRITHGVAERFTATGFRWGQIGTASLVSLAHGTNDAQKTMGVITLALIAGGEWHNTTAIPVWVKLACALAISGGTYLGGWRIIRTLGHRLVEITPPQGVAAEAASAAVILASSRLGFPLSTTHVATGSIIGTGLAGTARQVRWRVAGRLAAAWLLTVPAATAIGAAVWWIGRLPGTSPGARAVGAVLQLLVLAVVATALYRRSRATYVGADTVNAPRHHHDSSRRPAPERSAA